MVVKIVKMCSNTPTSSYQLNTDSFIVFCLVINSRLMTWTCASTSLYSIWSFQFLHTSLLTFAFCSITPTIRQFHLNTVPNKLAFHPITQFNNVFFPKSFPTLSHFLLYLPSYIPGPYFKDFWTVCLPTSNSSSCSLHLCTFNFQ